MVIAIEAFKLIELYEDDNKSVFIEGIIGDRLCIDKLKSFNIDQRKAEGEKFSYHLLGVEASWYQRLIEMNIFLKDFNF